MCSFWLWAILLFEFIHCIQGSVREECEEGWKLFGFNCYRFFPDPTDFQSAKESCERHNSTLSSVWSKAERNFIFSTLWNNTRREKAAWLGLVSDRYNASWKWLDGSQLDDLSRWPSRPSYPDDCGAITGWNAVAKHNCFNELLAAYVCKKPLIMLYGVGNLDNLTLPQPKANMKRMKVILFERVPPPRIADYNGRNKNLEIIKVSTETDCAYHCFRRDDCNAFKMICLIKTKCQFFACILISFDKAIHPYK